VRSLRVNKFPGSDAKHVWLIEFYAPWCQHCRRFKPVFERVARDLDGFVKVGAVNCEKEKQLCGVEGVNSYPSIKLKRGSATVAYEGERDAASLKAWALEQLPVRVMNVRKPAGLDSFFGRDATEGSADAKTRAVETTRFVFFSESAETPAWLKVAANELKGRFEFAEVRSRNEAVAFKLMDSVKFPSLIAVCDGDAERTAEYQGELRHEMKPNEIVDWVESFATTPKDGTLPWKCASIKPTPKTGTTLDASLQYESMRVGKLKAILAAHDIPCVLCAEKTDFTKAIRDAIAARAEL